MVASAPASHKSRELLLRLLSAAVLIPFALFVVSQGGTALGLSCALFAAVMGYEWARMTASPNMPLAAVFSALPAIAATFSGFELAALVLLICGAVVGALHPSSVSDKVGAAFGLFYSAGLPLALFLLRDGDWNGQAAALILMGTVWASDSGAYFAGKGFGGPPLSPKDSPSKTWSGALGAVLCSALCGLIAAGILDTERVPWLFAGIAISVSAQWGDLFESSLKRRFGVKDTSGFLPGHGGVMDRVDGLGMACVVGLVVLTVFEPLPGLLGLDG
ncbi:MAG: phosphatidate cytidylyltransferase [Henriciella sp.]|uniref:phosphatidate cytidylyltransferase n=1 Tax=Henriciella sp. TaxID=1968823 RepID=UPI003C7734C4